MSTTRLRPPGFGAPARLRPAGFDARPERPSSLRAQAQRVYRERVESAEIRGEERPTELTEKIRALYEAGVVPVAEIARIAGVHQRTLYRYVEKGGWRRRYGGKGIASAVRKRALKRRPRPCVTLKGAGGRFIRNADAGQPIRRGLKALDAAAEARALPRAGRAAALSEEAMARTKALREAIGDVRVMALLAGVARDLAAREDADARATADAETARREKEARLAEMREALARKLDAAVQGWEAAEARGEAWDDDEDEDED